MLTSFPQTVPKGNIWDQGVQGQGKATWYYCYCYAVVMTCVSCVIIIAAVVVFLFLLFLLFSAICRPRGGLLCRACNKALQIASPVPGRVRIFELAFGFGMILGPSSLVPIGSRSGIIMITSPRLLALLSVYWWLKIYYLFISRFFFPFFFSFLPIAFF